MPHFITNRGKLRLLQGVFDDDAGTDIGVGLLLGSAAPSGLDTEGEIQDLNTVAELLAVTGVDEPSDGSYARVSPITRGNATEDDTNNRVNMDANDVDFGALDNSDIYAAFFFIDAGGADSGNDLLSVDLFATPVTANGAGFTYAISDVYRAT
jgi:hypothetical protein